MKKKLIGAIVLLAVVATGFAYQYGPCVGDTLCVVGDLAAYVKNTDWNTSIADEPAILLDSSGRDIEMEGTTLDGAIMSIVPTDPTADRVMTLPNSTFTSGAFTISFTQGGAVADAVDQTFWVADRAYIATAVSATWMTAESTGAMDIMLEKLVGVTACGSGTDMLASAIDATATANTTTAGSLHATAANYTLAAGDTICVDLTATPNEVVGIVATISLLPSG